MNHTSFTLFSFTLVICTLQKGASPFVHPYFIHLRLMHPSEGWITHRSPFLVSPLSYAPFRRVLHPSFTLIWFTLVVHSPFGRVIHPSKGWSTLHEGCFTLKGERVHPFLGWISSFENSFTLREGWFTLQKGWMEGCEGWITLRRVNGGSPSTL